MFSVAVAALLCVAPVDADFVVSDASDPVGAVVFLHGWSHGLTVDEVLPVLPATPMVEQIVDAGWSVYMPFLDSDWGTGVDVVEATVEAARGDGFDRIRIVGVSAGGLTGLNWAWRHPDAFEHLYLVTPVFDLAAVYAADTPESWVSAPSITDSIDARFDGGSFAGFDPAQNTEAIVAVAGRVSVYAASDDEIIDWASLATWAGELGIDVTVSDGGHIFATMRPTFTATVDAWFGHE